MELNVVFINTALASRTVKPNRRRLLTLITSAGTVSLAGCGGGDGDGGGDGGGADDTGADDDGGSGTDSTAGSDGTSADSDGGGGDNGGTTDGTGTDAGTSTTGDTGSDEELRPGDVTGTAQSSVDEIDVVSHEVTAVDPQVRIELELRNAGDESNIALAHHNFDVGLFDAGGNDILRDQGSRGPEDLTGAGETGVVELFLTPERETSPASYEITVNCDVQNEGFSYCEG